MLLQDIRPFVRFARYLRIDESALFCRNTPLDARIFYALEGEGVIETCGARLSIPTGGVLFIPALTSYHIQPCNVTYIALNFDFTQAHSHVTIPVEPIPASSAKHPEAVETAEFTDAVYFNTPMLCENHYDIRADLLRIEEEYTKKLPFYQQETSGRLTAVLSRMARQAGKRASKGNRFDMDAMMDYIRAHLHEPLDNETLARQFHFHPNYISAEFKNAVGQPLHSFVLEARILHAISLIEAGQRDISKIAQSCGFASANYFTRYFKKRMGVTPGAYMRRGK